MSAPWQAKAACSQSHPDLFLPLTQKEAHGLGGNTHLHPRIRMAMAVCVACPVRAACLEAAIEGREAGVWGGRYLSAASHWKAASRKKRETAA
jgi:hypothetical protein